ncbi:MAG: hypothetical protein AB1344_09060 [Pseudomonadota bacterium]
MMAVQFGLLKKRFEGMQTRERVLIIAVGVVLVWALAQVLYFNAAAKQEKRLQTANKGTQQNIALLEANQMVLRTRLDEDGLATRQAKLDELKRRRQALDDLLHQQGLRLLNPERMREVLHDLLRGSELRLISMQRLPVGVAYSTEPKVEQDTSRSGGPGQDMTAARDAGSPGKHGVTVYRHAVQIELEGNYAGMVEYLERLERSGWRLMWQALDIETRDYPSARLRLTVYTLSLEEDWIGV